MADESFIPPKISEIFIGRRPELDWLEREVYGTERRYAEMPIVVVGVGGIGKTALVAEFIRRFETRRQVIWIRCSEFERNSSAFEEVMRSKIEEHSLREVVVVLDGADEISEEQFRVAFRRVTNFKRVRTVIITSRAELKLRGERVLRLENMPESDAQSLVKDQLFSSALSPESLLKVLGVANGHPLTISLIAKMAQSLDPEQTRRVLDGNLYDLNDNSPAAKKNLITAARPVIISANEAMIAGLKKQPKDIFKLTPRQYEELVAELIHDMGYEVTLTKATRDGGKDILASIKTEVGDFLCLVEAKHYREDRKIGVSLVRTLYGTLCDYQANSAMLVTTSSYSKDAHTLQQKHKYQLSLRDYTDVTGWIQHYGARKMR
jgi:HJR/Mrr/RecB family endonuclease